MSYDVWIEIDTGGLNPARVWGSLNYTSNVSGMWSRALESTGFKGPSSDPPRLRDLDGLVAKEALGPLRAASAWMRDHQIDLVPLEPPNGWGSVGGATKFLEDIAVACADHPKATLRFDW